MPMQLAFAPIFIRLVAIAEQQQMHLMAALGKKLGQVIETAIGLRKQIPALRTTFA